MKAAPDTAAFFAVVPDKSDGTALRGNYGSADAQYVVRQDMAAYTPAEQARWRRLYQRQAGLLPGRACREFIAALTALQAEAGIPDLARTSLALRRATGWSLVAVPGLIPDEVFFTHLANRRFPVTVWLRAESEFDYVVEPDLFHDYFGHVPLLFNPLFAEHMQQYGKGGLRALGGGHLALLARLYWYTVEFGLIDGADGLRAYGAGILSSAGEIDYCLHDRAPLRLPFSLARCMRTLYKIDAYQETYFVIRSFQQLFDETACDFMPIYAQLQSEPTIAAGA